AGRAKQGVEAQESMLQTASNVLHDNLENVVRQWPDLDTVDPFYLELADAIVGVDDLRQSLSELSWAAEKTHDLGREYIGRLPGDDPETARKLRKQAFARMGSVVNEVGDDLAFVGEARDSLKTLPDISPDEPAIVTAGYPNVGKTAFVNAVTNARNETAAYPFTTKGVRVGHVERAHVRYQLVDTPGLLDRPAAERNDIESQAVSALTHLADAVLFLLDPSETCGYPLDRQRALLDELRGTFDVPFVVVANKVDLLEERESLPPGAEHGMVIPDHGAPTPEAASPAEVLDIVVDAIGYEPELPFEDS
ncbi:MAG: NOG1 family protein, partial [Halodesulfurarchaeum sp.]